MNNHQWVNTIRDRLKESGPSMGPEGQAWIRSARSWWTQFRERINAQEWRFSKNHYEFSIVFRVENQWWYMNSGDVRFSVMGSALIRTTTGPKDYTGGRNQFVGYDSPDFDAALERIIKG